MARDSITLSKTRRTPLLRRVFAWMSRLAAPELSRYGLPPQRVIEVGMRIEL